MNLRSKILLFTTVPVLTVIVAVVSLGWYELENRLVAERRNELRSELVNAAQVIGQETREAIAVARLMAEAQESGQFGRREPSLAMARQVLEENPDFIGTSIGYEPNADGADRAWPGLIGSRHNSSDKTGRFLPHWFRDPANNSRISLEPLTGLDTAPFYEGLRKQYQHNRNDDCIVTEPHIANGEALIVEQACVIERDGHFAGITAVDRSLDPLSRHLTSLRPLKNSQFVLISGRGRILATTLGDQYQEQLRTVRVHDLYRQPDGRLATNIYRTVDGKKEIDPDKASHALLNGLGTDYQDMIDRIVTTADTGEVIEVTSPLTGVRNMAAAAHVPTGDWNLLLYLDRDEVTAPVRANIWWILLVVVVGTSIAVWLLVRLANRLSGRVGLLAEDARRVTGGDLTLSVVVDSDDEIGVLQRTLGDMIGNLRGLIGDVKRSGIRLTAAANELGAGVRQQESAIVEFGSSAREIAAAAQQISGTSRELAGMVSELAGGTRETADLAGAGRDSVSAMTSTMDRVTRATRLVSDRLRHISEKAESINVVVSAVIKIADQTNLLSLNAAMEAEKAGASGRGFHVVAQEVRRLADQTAGATLEIEEMVREMQSAVSAGVTTMDHFSREVRQVSERTHRTGAQLEQIIRQVEELTERFGAVVGGTQSQAEGAEQISEALASLSEGVRKTSAALTGYRRGGASLEKTVVHLRSEIAGFQTGRERSADEADAADLQS